MMAAVRVHMMGIIEGIVLLKAGMTMTIGVMVLTIRT
jgi:hypothetical protein